MTNSSECGRKNPSTMNNIGAETSSKKRKKTQIKNIKFPKIKPTAEVFQQLESLPRLTEFERANLSKLNIRKKPVDIIMYLNHQTFSRAFF